MLIYYHLKNSVKMFIHNQFVINRKWLCGTVWCLLVQESLGYVWRFFFFFPSPSATTRGKRIVKEERLCNELWHSGRPWRTVGKTKGFRPIGCSVEQGHRYRFSIFHVILKGFLAFKLLLAKFLCNQVNKVNGGFKRDLNGAFVFKQLLPCSVSSPTSLLLRAFTSSHTLHICFI